MSSDEHAGVGHLSVQTNFSCHVAAVEMDVGHVNAAVSAETELLDVNPVIMDVMLHGESHGTDIYIYICSGANNLTTISLI